MEIEFFNHKTCFFEDFAVLDEKFTCLRQHVIELNRRILVLMESSEKVDYDNFYNIYVNIFINYTNF